MNFNISVFKKIEQNTENGKKYWKNRGHFSVTQCGNHDNIETSSVDLQLEA